MDPQIAQRDPWIAQIHRLRPTKQGPGYTVMSEQQDSEQLQKSDWPMVQTTRGGGGLYISRNEGFMLPSFTSDTQGTGTPQPTSGKWELVRNW